MENKYDDIINLPHYEPQKHSRMSIEARSAQFAPFSALTGYAEEVKETSRTTDKKIYLSNEQKIIINNKLMIILNNIYDKPEVKIIYFVPDKNKEGGKYIEKKGIIKKIDKINQYVQLTDDTKIFISEIIDIESKLFKEIE